MIALQGIVPESNIGKGLFMSIQNPAGWIVSNADSSLTSSTLGSAKSFLMHSRGHAPHSSVVTHPRHAQFPRDQFSRNALFEAMKRAPILTDRRAARTCNQISSQTAIAPATVGQFLAAPRNCPSYPSARHHHSGFLNLSTRCFPRNSHACNTQQ